MLKCLISFSGDWDLFESCLVLLTVGTRDWGNNFSMPLVLGKMPRVCPVAAQVIAFKNDGALCPYLGYLYPYRIFKLSTNYLHVCYDWFPTPWCWMYVYFGGSWYLQYWTYAGFGGGWYLQYQTYVGFGGSWYFILLMLILRFNDLWPQLRSIGNHQ